MQAMASVRRWSAVVAVVNLALLLAALTGSLVDSRGEEKGPAAKAQGHGRGHVERRDSPQLRARKSLEFGPLLKRLYRAVTPPAAWDSRTRGWVPAVVSQGNCGSCWDFSGTGMVDIAYAIAAADENPDAAKHSEQYTLDCYQNGGCSGDDNTTVLEHAQSTGLPLAKDYGPYTASRGRCKWTSAMGLERIDKWGYVDPSGLQDIPQDSQIKAAIMAYGCVGSAVAAGEGWDSYSSGVFHGGGNRAINHDVIIVGWDDAKSTRSGRTVWLMRNSWGRGWGEKGYMWIESQADQIGTQAVWCTVAAPSPPRAPQPPPGPTPPPGPGPMPGAYWSGTIEYQEGRITTVTPSPAKKQAGGCGERRKAG